MAGNGVRPPPMWTQEGRQFALSHPARKQVDEPNGRAAVSAVSAGGGEYNIWCADMTRPPSCSQLRRAAMPALSMPLRLRRYGKICHNREHRQDFGKCAGLREPMTTDATQSLCPRMADS